MQGLVGPLSVGLFCVLQLQAANSVCVCGGGGGIARKIAYAHSFLFVGRTLIYQGNERKYLVAIRESRQLVKLSISEAMELSLYLPGSTKFFCFFFSGVAVRGCDWMGERERERERGGGRGRMKGRWSCRVKGRGGGGGGGGRGVRISLRCLLSISHGHIEQ